MENLPLAFLEKDPMAREPRHYAATMAGIGFANSAKAIGHAIALKAGAAFELTHGRAKAIALPFTIKIQGGIPIIQHNNTAIQLAEMFVKIEAARCLT